MSIDFTVFLMNGFLTSVWRQYFMSDKPTAAWYLAPIFLGIIGSGIMWYVLKDEEHESAPKMVKKGWVIGIVLTVLSFAWVPIVIGAGLITDAM